MRKLIKKNPLIQVGVWLVDNHFELVWLTAKDDVQNNEKNTPHFCRIPCTEQAQLMPKILAEIQATLPTSSFQVKFITAILPHQLWAKTLILQQSLSASEYEQQCRYTLEQELPITLEELWYDYTNTPLKQGVRLDIFAVRKTIAQNLLQQFSPLKIDVLSTAVHCLFKAFCYLSKRYVTPSSLFIYQEKQWLIAFRQSTQEWQVVSQMHSASISGENEHNPTETASQSDKTAVNLTALYQQFAQRYNDVSEIFVYSSADEIMLDKPYQRLRCAFSPIALGAALWQTELQQDENIN
ncbi:hypothetical protein A4G18_06355 [Pasteurellaceae bacterium Pebbles2]|nr:hypothetical protein [Pasteurellaceae bacterium Pebbles2]